MYPILFRIGDFEVTSFGAMVAAGALTALWLFQRELQRTGLPAEAVGAAYAGLLGGVVGAKLLWVAEHFGEEPLTGLLLSRGGLSWFGGLIGGVGAGVAFILVKGWPLSGLLAAATPALAVGHALGRIGCFLVGDDYGTPTDLPWAVAFPEGLPPTITPVHPTQLYEAAGLVPIAWLLSRYRARHRGDGFVIGVYLVLTASLRFAIELIRINERVAFGMTVAQWASVALVAAGAVMILRARNPGRE